MLTRASIISAEIPKHKLVQIAGLDFLEAADFHINYRNKLVRLIDGNIRDAGDDLSVWGAVDCHLGYWLSHKGKHTFAQFSSFQHLVTAHAEFHRHVDMILVRVWAGAFVEADELLKNDFSQSTRRILIALNEFHDHVQENFVKHEANNGKA